MRVRAQFVGFPQIVRRLGRNDVEVDLQGATVGDLLRWVQRNHGDPTRTALLDRCGLPDESVRILRNGTEWIPREGLEQGLREGDEVTFLVFVAGG